MSATTGIEWTDATWNPVTGCTEVSPGCDHCYAKAFAERWRGTPGHYFEHGFDVQLRPDKLDLPLRWKKPRRIFVNSMSDLFHDAVPDEYIADVFRIMAAAPRHTFQVLTKRHARMRSLLNRWAETGLPTSKLHSSLTVPVKVLIWSSLPLPNVWLGVSAENQQWADIRIPALLDTPAAVRFVSAEPLLGPISIFARSSIDRDPGLDWVIVGGESGSGARPMHPAWARGLRDECSGSGTAFLFKQWGEWAPIPELPAIGSALHAFDDGVHVQRYGKKSAGRLLDGRTWDEYPEPVPA